MSSSSSAHSTFDHISAVEAGRQFGFTNDYITRLAREKKVVAERIGRQWYVDAKSLESFVAKSEEAKKEYTERLRTERKRERAESSSAKTIGAVRVIPAPSSRASVLAKAGMVVCAGVMLGGLIFSTAETVSTRSAQEANVFESLKAFALSLYGFGDAPVVPTPTSQAQPLAAQAAALEKQGGGDADALIVIPPGDARSTSSVAASFSDEVRVTRDASGKSGVITPIFSKGTSTPYRYLLVPLERAGSSP